MNFNNAKIANKPSFVTRKAIPKKRCENLQRVKNMHTENKQFDTTVRLYSLCQWSCVVTCTHQPNPHTTASTPTQTNSRERPSASHDDKHCRLSSAVRIAVKSLQHGRIGSRYPWDSSCSPSSLSVNMRIEWCIQCAFVLWMTTKRLCSGLWATITTVCTTSVTRRNVHAQLTVSVLTAFNIFRIRSATLTSVVTLVAFVRMICG